MQAPSALGAVSSGVLAGNVVQHQTPRWLVFFDLDPQHLGVQPS
jgi:hypothetical protein